VSLPLSITRFADSVWKNVAIEQTCLSLRRTTGGHLARPFSQSTLLHVEDMPFEYRRSLFEVFTKYLPIGRKKTNKSDGQPREPDRGRPLLVPSMQETIEQVASLTVGCCGVERFQATHRDGHD